MIATPVACVVDASVGIKLVVTEALSTEAHALFDHLPADPAARFFVPDLFDIECANILWKQIVRAGYPYRPNLGQGRRPDGRIVR